MVRYAGTGEDDPPCLEVAPELRVTFETATRDLVQPRLDRRPCPYGRQCARLSVSLQTWMTFPQVRPNHRKHRDQRGEEQCAEKKMSFRAGGHPVCIGTRLSRLKVIGQP
jgi:hypothetical protein